MALSYIEYAGDGTQATYTTPKYLQEDHLVVAVDGELKSSPTDYNVLGETVTFVTAPANGAEIRIGRQTSQNLRLNDYQDGSLMTADVLDDDANQLFYMAQEAIDTASEVNFAASTFYVASGTAPTSPSLGDLWYDTTSKVLKIYNGTGFELTIPENETETFTTFTDTVIGGGNYSYIEVDDVNVNCFVFLNGVKLVRDTSFPITTADYFIALQSNRIYFETLAASDVVQVTNNYSVINYNDDSTTGVDSTEVVVNPYSNLRKYLSSVPTNLDIEMARVDSFIGGTTWLYRTQNFGVRFGNAPSQNIVQGSSLNFTEIIATINHSGNKFRFIQKILNIGDIDVKLRLASGFTNLIFVASDGTITENSFDVVIPPGHSCSVVRLHTDNTLPYGTDNTAIVWEASSGVYKATS